MNSSDSRFIVSRWKEKELSLLPNHSTLSIWPLIEANSLFSKTKLMKMLINFHLVRVNHQWNRQCSVAKKSNLRGQQWKVLASGFVVQKELTTQLVLILLLYHAIHFLVKFWHQIQLIQWYFILRGPKIVAKCLQFVRQGPLDSQSRKIGWKYLTAPSIAPSNFVLSTLLSTPLMTEQKGILDKELYILLAFVFITPANLVTPHLLCTLGSPLAVITFDCLKSHLGRGQLLKNWVKNVHHPSC